MISKARVGSCDRVILVNGLANESVLPVIEAARIFGPFTPLSVSNSIVTLIVAEVPSGSSGM
jgi:hypothetical protein